MVIKGRWSPWGEYRGAFRIAGLGGECKGEQCLWLGYTITEQGDWQTTDHGASNERERVKKAGGIGWKHHPRAYGRSATTSAVADWSLFLWGVVSRNTSKAIIIGNKLIACRFAAFPIGHRNDGTGENWGDSWVAFAKVRHLQYG
jgi:hypothetical protein